MGLASMRALSHPGTEWIMRRRTRRLIGTAILVAFVSLYPLLVMVLVQTRPVQRIPVLLIYLVLGFCWIVPVMPLIKWMERNDV
jgi:hypothetical protein